MTEKLIEEARRTPQSAPKNLIPLVLRLADALEAAEKAHTPTDDELEALTHLFIQWQKRTGGLTNYSMMSSLANIALAAGFRRSDVPEPNPLLTVIQDAYNAWHMESRSRAIEILHEALSSSEVPEPQGTPSDAQVRAAVLAWRSMGGGRLGTSSMRVALGAALRVAAPKGESPCPHDDDCEAEYVVGAVGYTDCGCGERATEADHRKAVSVGAAAISKILDDRDMPWNPEVLADAALRAAGVGGVR